MSSRIKYKVVQSMTRTSAIASSFPFSTKYYKNQVIKKYEGTLGIFVFDRRIQAEKFIKRIFAASAPDLPKNFFTIIRVVPIGRGKRPRKISLGGHNIRRFYFSDDPDVEATTNIPFGTICYDSVYPID